MTILLISFLIAFVYGSFCEWVLHKFVMHKPLGKFTYPYTAHTKTHHRQFRANEAYHLIDSEKQSKGKIPMAWWNFLVFIAVFPLPFVIPAVLWENWLIWFGAFLAVGCYYVIYEYIHWCFHLPKERRVEMCWLFRRLNGHHLLHHRYMGKNFNVVFPLADLCLGTLILRSKTPFTQPKHPAVPNVQP